LDLLAKLKTVTLCPPALPNYNYKNLGIKIKFILEYLRERIDQGIIIFSTRSETFLNPLSEELKKNEIDLGIITGKTNQKDRQTYIEKFQNSEIKVLLCNIQSANVGIKLSKAETIIFADRSYSPSDNEQAEARFLPTDISEELPRIRMIIDLVCRNTIDEKILKLLKRKEGITDILKRNPEFLFE
jgi:SNF2 family DNA or RNA helicase